MAFLQDYMYLITMEKLSVSGLENKMGTFVTCTCVCVCVFCSLLHLL